MRLALISDIHGNNVALEAVLTAISTQHIAQVICLGDQSVHCFTSGQYGDETTDEGGDLLGER